MNKIVIALALGSFLLAACTNDLVSDVRQTEEADVNDVRQGMDTRSADSGLLIAEVEAVADTPEEFIKHVTPDYISSMFELLMPEMPDVFSPFFTLLVDKRLPQLDALFKKRVGEDETGRRWKVESYVFHYKSKSSTGEDIVLSGRVTFPNNTVAGVDHQVKTLTLHSHQYLLDTSWAPSRTYSMMTLRALQNSAVIEPDFQGYGVSEQYGYPGLSAAVLARQLSDCAMAALDVMRRHGVTLASDGYSTSWGISIAAAVPIAFAKYYETEAPEQVRKALRLASSFAAEGPTDVPTLIRYYDQHPSDYMYLALVMLATISDFSEDSFGGYAADDFFSDTVLNTMVNLGGVELPLLKCLREKLISLTNIYLFISPSSLTDILASEMFTPDGHIDESSAKVKALFGALDKQSSLYEWVPRIPLYMACCPQDEGVPYEHIKHTYNRLSINGLNPRVHWASVPIDGLNSPIGVMGAHMLSCFIMMLEMSCAAEPADMYKFYE